MQEVEQPGVELGLRGCYRRRAATTTTAAATTTTRADLYKRNDVSSREGWGEKDGKVALSRSACLP